MKDVYSSWNLEEVSEAILNSSNCTQALVYLGKTPNRGAKKQLRKIIKLNNLSTDHFKPTPALRKHGSIGLEHFTENCTLSSTTVRSFLKRNKILDFTICSICKITDEWNGKKLTLQLDHINGDNVDNRLENLRILCPNCHSQTDTYTNKKRLDKPSNPKNPKKYSIKSCENCPSGTKDESGLCRKCYYKKYKRYYTKNNTDTAKYRKFEVSKEKLIELVNDYPMTKIGEMFNVSDNAIRKRCNILEIIIPPHRKINRPKSKN